MIVLITGSAGYIGKNLYNFLIENGFKVFGLDKKKNKLLECDILNYEKLDNIIREIKPEVIIHLAARTDLNGNKISYYDVNTQGTKNIIKIANSTPSIKKIIFTSSMLVNDIQKKNFYCNVNYYDPKSLYGESKVQMEKIIKISKTNFYWCIIRPTTIWGEGVPNHLTSMLKYIKKGFFFNIYKYNCMKNYGYIHNSCYQIQKLISADVSLISKKVFYLCDYKPFSIKDWTNKISIIYNGKKNKELPKIIFKIFALIGDLIILLGFKNFPIQSRRLSNLLNDCQIDNENLKKYVVNYHIILIKV